MKTKAPSPGTQTLAYKQSVLNGIVAAIEFQKGKPVPWSIQEKLEAYEYGLTQRLNELVEHCKNEEIDLKIASMREVSELLKDL